MRQAFFNLDHGALFARQWGNEAAATEHRTAVLMLHPSPLSSRVFESFAPTLSADVWLVAPDTPGYGLSDQLPTPPTSLSDYLPPLLELLDQLNLMRVKVYGSATGAQLGIELAKAAPDRVDTLIIDNAAHFSDGERQDILGEYFPDLSPKPDGSHLSTLWRMARNSMMYFPWHDERPEAQFAPMPEPSIVQASVADFVRAGANYDQAYRLAFFNERAEQLAKVTVPTKVICWQSSPILKYVEALLAHDLPRNIERCDVAAGMDARLAALQTLFA